MRKIIVTLLSVIPWLMIIIITGQIDYTNYFSFLGYHVVPLIGLVYSILIGLRPDKFLMNVSKAKNKNMWSTVESIITYIVLFLYATVFLNFFASQRETLIVVGLQTILISNLIGFIFYTIINGLYNNLEG